jgi:hypothetical protein
MSGFSHDNKFDIDGAVTIRAVKVTLRESIPKLRVIMDQKRDEGFESVLRQPLRQQETIHAMPVFAFAKAILVHPDIQVLYGNGFGASIIRLANVLVDLDMTSDQYIILFRQ